MQQRVWRLCSSTCRLVPQDGGGGSRGTRLGAFGWGVRWHLTRNSTKGGLLASSQAMAPHTILDTHGTSRRSPTPGTRDRNHRVHQCLRLYATESATGVQRQPTRLKGSSTSPASRTPRTSNTPNTHGRPGGGEPTSRRAGEPTSRQTGNRLRMHRVARVRHPLNGSFTRRCCPAPPGSR